MQLSIYKLTLLKTSKPLPERNNINLYKKAGKSV